MPTWNRKQTGNHGEKLAIAYLTRKWYTIVDTNYQIKGGELDIIAKKDAYYHFVEVRYRKNDLYGHPLDTLWAKKRFSLKRTMFHYIHRYGINIDFCQCDCIAIMPNDTGWHRVWHVENIAL